MLAHIGVRFRYRWIEPSYELIVGYSVLYTTDPTLQDDQWSVEEVLADRTTAILRDLELRRTHYFKIRAQRRSGEMTTSKTSAYETPFGIL